MTGIYPGTNSVSYTIVVNYITDRYSARIVPKRDSRLMRIIDICLRIITFGKMTTFLNSFVTTIGTTIYVPDDWEPSPSAAVVLRHEAVHLEQQRQYGPVLFALLYLFWPLPAVFAKSRTRFEQEAYAETLLALVQWLGPERLTEDLRESIIQHFTSAEYFWMCPFRQQVEQWYDDAARRARYMYDAQQVIHQAQQNKVPAPLV